ncbi:hypothetical protein PRZ48_002247 [Zasmidium cellare]|uniref:Uncharacterized protein n=1 Tax=Zasmidium cellare TaxID=395010 RepID=A0ABR0F6D1_ZASCE|nr:hypothetical protein PRZ48_002247 [Zasmidium cellare]
MFGKKFRFSRIPSTDNGDDGEDLESEDKNYQHEHGTSDRRWITWPRSLAVISLVVISSFAIISTATRSPNPTWTSCGNNPATARSRGCSFDLLSFAWQTPECFDGDLMAEFASWDGDWNFYSDDEYSTVVGQDIALRGERSHPGLGVFLQSRVLALSPGQLEEVLQCFLTDLDGGQIKQFAAKHPIWILKNA